MTDAEWVTIAKIIKTQGNRGEVAADLLTDFPERFELVRDVLLQNTDGSERNLTLESFWFHKGRVILKFQEADTISAAETLRGCEVRIPKATIMPLSNGSYYQHDLIDCIARDRDGTVYGRVTEVLSTPAGYLLRIDQGHGDFLLPFAESMLIRIDIANKELICDLPNGLESL